MQHSSTYTYDNLSRLIVASTTMASSSPYKHTFTYSPIGNMTGMATTGATTTYTYAETGSTNPSAPTSIGSGSLTYDTNGNLTAYNATKYTWDYRNRVTTIGNGTATTTFAYDHTFERVKKVSGGVTTYYINDLYNKAGATTTKYIYDNGGVLLATLEGNGVSTTTQYQHQDHLGGTNVLTSAYGNVVTTMDYYPYGDTRIQSGTFTSKRTFIGEVSDAETDLNYLNARYYDSNRGQFVSQDPVFWEVGETKEGISVMYNPQVQNSYSYAQNNPITLKDANGRCPLCIFVVTATLYGLEAYGGIKLIETANDYRLTQVYPDAYTQSERDNALSTLIYESGTALYSSTLKGAKETLSFAGVKMVTDFTRQTTKQAGKVIMSPDDLHYVSTPALPNNVNSGKTNYNTPGSTISAPGSTKTSPEKSSSSYNLASGYLNSAQKALNRGDLKTAEKYLNKAKKIVNGK